MATWEHSAAEDEGHSPVRIGWKLVVLGATAAGLLSGLRIYLTYNALGAGISFADAMASGVMDWWMWIPLAPLV